MGGSIIGCRAANMRKLGPCSRHLLTGLEWLLNADVLFRGAPISVHGRMEDTSQAMHATSLVVDTALSTRSLIAAYFERSS